MLRTFTQQLKMEAHNLSGLWALAVWQIFTGHRSLIEHVCTIKHSESKIRIEVKATSGIQRFESSLPDAGTSEIEYLNFIDEQAIPKPEQSLTLEGVINNGFIKGEYVNSFHGVSNYGSLHAKIINGHTIRGKFAGYGNITKDVVDGRVFFDKYSNEEELQAIQKTYHSNGIITSEEFDRKLH